MTEGMKSTEFWLALAAQLLGLLGASGALNTDQATELTRAATQIAAGIMAGAAALGYPISRGIRKAGRR